MFFLVILHFLCNMIVMALWMIGNLVVIWLLISKQRQPQSTSTTLLDHTSERVFVSKHYTAHLQLKIKPKMSELLSFLTTHEEQFRR